MPKSSKSAEGATRGTGKGAWPTVGCRTGGMEVTTLGGINKGQGKNLICSTNGELM